jgi:hypothetical protein
MRKTSKLAIFALATLLSLAMFNMIASPSVVDMLVMGKEAGYHMISNHLAMQVKASESKNIIAGECELC